VATKSRWSIADKFEAIDVDGRGFEPDGGWGYCLRSPEFAEVNFCLGVCQNVHLFWFWEVFKGDLLIAVTHYIDKLRTGWKEVA
jgi:hypothetical protein